MLRALFRRAQATVDNVVGAALIKVLTAVPFLIAGYFAINALSVRLHNEFGAENANLILAAIFLVIGLATLLVVNSRATAEDNESASDTQTANQAFGSEKLLAGLDLAPEDRELLVSTAKSLAPVGLPGLARMIFRNLPLLLAFAAAIFIFMRLSRDTGPAETGEEAAEPNV